MSEPRRVLPAPRLPGRPVPLPQVLWLTVIWLLLWGDLSVGNVLGGLLVGLVLVWLLPLPIQDTGLRLHPVWILLFLVRFVRDMMVSSFRVAFWALRLGRPPPMQLVEVRLRASSEAMAVLVTVALSALPGSLVLEANVRRRTLLLHVLGVPGDPATVGQVTQDDVTRLENRIVAAFGTRADQEEVR
ncbi:Na+/H+ antiporter subunit E [Streptosporangium sp. NBC_01755]|uniref:Na+/H+ antiporter subunit E n=1 Tax=unclassified Streptosporangium TaxID=2632669 RepID=UPI002DD900FF|nr:MULTISPECIES: Na+/H+ antiporter subunit E [unclassified Streptosporangium]WSA27577.1 Na+/H+ antiporter subunit E [Streptosporangium sp. NBC_01810]WSD00952.1 Na+/H+ antiporter subunit E [Streptosporangium sp. NBC_01755]